MVKEDASDNARVDAIKPSTASIKSARVFPDRSLNMPHNGPLNIPTIGMTVLIRPICVPLKPRLA